MQTMFWYDKPSAYEGEPELEFWKQIPTVWDETKVLQGEPGQFITTTRRKGEEWFVGTVTNNESRTVKVPFSFLPAGKKYIATIYSDDPKVATKTKVKVEKKKVDSKTVMTVNLMASGGQAIWLRPGVK